MAVNESVVRDRSGVPPRGNGTWSIRATALLLLAVFGPMVVVAWWYISFAVSAAKYGVCMANLRGIGQSLSVYEQRFGAYPWEFDDLVRAGIATPKDFCCPMAVFSIGDVDRCFVYIPGQSSASDPRNVLAYERRGHHEQFGTNVLFADMHAENVKGYDKVMKLVAETDGRLKAAERAGK